MPTRPRIDIAGYHHIINRGVDRMNIFCHSEDKDSFLQIVNNTAMIHKVIVHDYCLMGNHFHLLYSIANAILLNYFSCYAFLVHPDPKFYDCVHPTPFPQ